VTEEEQVLAVIVLRRVATAGGRWSYTEDEYRGGEQNCFAFISTETGVC
jgi:hypothetical protein